MGGLRVAVVGAGIGGAAAALVLAHHGVDVAVYERRSTVSPVGSGLGLARNGRRVLEDLGLGPELDRTGAPITTMRLLTSDGDEAGHYDVGALLGMRRADLLRILLGGLGADVVRRGRECVGVDVDGPRPVLRLADGSSVTADVVVGADGLHSRTAPVVTTVPAPHPSGTSALRGFVDATGLPRHLRSDQNAWLGPDRHLLSYPVDRHGTVNFAAFVPRPGGSADEWSFRVDPDDVRAGFAGWAEDVTALLARADEVYRWDLADRDPFTPWSRAGVVLLGDAAHPMLPHMGQGANQAIEDAAVLAALLADVSDPAGVPARLAAYEDERRPRTERIQTRSRRNGERFSTGSAPGGDLSWVHGYDAPAAGRAAAARVAGA
ncbi:FAD-dependent monooxygenase [Actinomycetospora termitidis]|uniref:FAD-dependent monooxygenase n=1 Tax=Actinomycetospora termitidis TaxID=3053470 RepID=A0ABT7M9F6_9PSEU|nr:FAD-dependent monooxygenase [Actinomycetospora sp. Odt1-22]MDL5157297.1 FAD-dependent monooxygenase [Actinomycetospora sp. Odt1-22]